MLKRILEFVFWAGLIGFLCLVDSTPVCTQLAWMLVTIAAGGLLAFLF